MTANNVLRLDTTLLSPKKNLAHALLFQGKYDEALSIYEYLKTKITKQGIHYSALCLADLNELESQGVTNKNVDKVRAFLSVGLSEAERSFKPHK